MVRRSFLVGFERSGSRQDFRSFDSRSKYFGPSIVVPRGVAERREPSGSAPENTNAVPDGLHRSATNHPSVSSKVDGIGRGLSGSALVGVLRLAARAKSLSAPTVFCVFALLLASAGCATAEKQVVPKDPVLVRSVRSGREAFDEGDLDEALKEYRRALLRAWAIDDPYESGTVAYNMAACMASRSEFTQAKDWLIDSRVELCRAKSSTGNAWLLSSEVAMAENELEVARICINRASQACPPCEIDDECCLCGPGESCSDEECELSCLEKLPGLGQQVRQENATEDCRLGYEARVQLAQARLAIKHLDSAGAAGHLQCAGELLTGVCNLSLQADWHDVAAQIDDLEANYLQAGAHRDRELKLLRCAGLYREMPEVLDAASLSYLSAERHDLAIDRMIRSARIWLSRKQLSSAWERVREASELAKIGACEAVEIRLALTAKMIQEAITNQRQTLDWAPETTKETPSNEQLPEPVLIPAE